MNIAAVASRGRLVKPNSLKAENIGIGQVPIQAEIRPHSTPYQVHSFSSNFVERKTGFSFFLLKSAQFFFLVFTDESMITLFLISTCTLFVTPLFSNIDLGNITHFEFPICRILSVVLMAFSFFGLTQSYYKQPRSK
jgi:hypothetical protein